MLPKTRTATTILIVTDQPRDRQTLEALLVTLGYQIYFANNRAQALMDGPPLNPDVILVDGDLGGSDGLKICQEFRANPEAAEIPILLFTNRKDNGAYQAAYNAGASDLVTKPFRPLELKARLRNLVLLARYRKNYQESKKAPSQSDPQATIDPNLTLLQRVITTIAAQLDPYEILYSSCEMISQVFGTSQVAAWIEKDGGESFEQVAQYPLFPSSHADPKATRPSHSVVRASLLGEVISIEENPWLSQLLKEKQLVTLSGKQLRGREVADKLGKPKSVLKPKLFIPLITKGEVTGFLELEGDPAKELAPSEIELAKSIAITVGESLEAVKLFRRLQDYAEFLDNSLAQRTQELEGERDRTHSILEALGEAVVVTDLEGCIQYVNRAAIKLTGYKPEELLGQRMRLWRSHRQTAELYTQMLSKVQEGRTWRGEVINERKDGTLYDAALTVAPLYGGSEDKHPIGYVSVQHDITPVKEAERIKDQFVSNVSHELRTPLSVITLLVGNLDALYERMDDEKRRKLIRDIRGNIQVLNDLIINVLEISRLDGRHVARELQPLDLAQIVREEVEKQTLLAKNKYQNLLVDGVEHLPIHGSEVQLRQVIRNLVNNAIKYTPEGGYILCECQIDFNENGEDSKWPGHADLPEGPWVGVRIKDTGMGISDEDQTRLFERFFRVKSQGNVPGAGLGLSIAREIVKLHGGQISFASQVHEGSVFAVYFPLREVVS